MPISLVSRRSLSHGFLSFTISNKGTFFFRKTDFGSVVFAFQTFESHSALILKMGSSFLHCQLFAFQKFHGHFKKTKPFDVFWSRRHF